MKALQQAEATLREMSGTIDILVSLSAHPEDIGRSGAWSKLAGDLDAHAARLEEQLDRVGDEHRAELAAVQEQKAAHGSAEDRERVEALWELLSGVVGIAGRQCAEAGYPVGEARLVKDEPAGFVDG